LSSAAAAAGRAVAGRGRCGQGRYHTCVGDWLACYKKVRTATDRRGRGGAVS